jgi:formyltetrahydrofolate deformylase
VSPDQHWTEQSGGTFMQRTIFHLQGLTTARDALERDFGPQVAVRFNMDFRLIEASKPKRVAVVASKADHCLLDLTPNVEWLRLVISATEPRKDDLS